MIPTRKLLHYCGIGSGDPAQTPRGVLLPDHDWGKLYDSFEPMAEQGLRRWVLWMPFGRDSLRVHNIDFNGVINAHESTLRIEQRSLALQAGMTKLVDGFGPATQKFLTADTDREVICYLGTILDAEEWDGDTCTHKELRDRLDKELAPYLEAGVSLAFDCTSQLPESHWFFPYLTKLEKRTRAYTEAWPQRGYEHLSQFPSIALAEQFRNYCELYLDPNYPPQPDGFRGIIDESKRTAERQVWLVNQLKDDDKENAEWYRQVVPALLADPCVDSVAIYVDKFLSGGGNLGELQPDWRGMVEW